MFEAAGAESPGGLGVPLGVGPVVVEVYDGAGSGLGVGLMLGAMAALIIAGLVVAVQFGSGASSALASQMSGNLPMWAGGLAGVVLILGLVGWFIGKASE